MVLNGTCPTVFVMGTSYISVNWYRIFHSSYLFTAARSATLLFVFTFFLASSIDSSLALRLYGWQFLVCNCFRGLFRASITADIPYSSQFVHRINFCNIFSPLFCCFWVLNYYQYGHWRFSVAIMGKTARSIYCQLRASTDSISVQKLPTLQPGSCALCSTDRTTQLQNVQINFLFAYAYPSEYNTERLFP